MDFKTTEKELMRLQDIYLRDRDDETYQLMFDLLKNYARSIVLNTIRNKVFLDPNKVEEVAVDATIKIMEGYKLNPDYKTLSSFGGWIKFPILHYLFGPQTKKHDRVVSLNTSLGDDENSKELIDNQEILHVKNHFDTNLHPSPEDTFLEKLNTIEDELNSVFSELKGEISIRSYLLIKIGVLLYFRKPKIKKFLETFQDLKLTFKERRTLEFVLLEIYKRISNVNELH